MFARGCCDVRWQQKIADLHVNWERLLCGLRRGWLGNYVTTKPTLVSHYIWRAHFEDAADIVVVGAVANAVLADVLVMAML